MATDAYIGDPFVFQVVYLDDTGTPIPVTNVRLDVFVYDTTTGDRILLVTGGVMSLVVPPDPSRYYYPYTIPSLLADGTVLYVEYRATVTSTGDTSVSSDVLNLHARPSDLGLRTRFVR